MGTGICRGLESPLHSPRGNVNDQQKQPTKDWLSYLKDIHDDGLITDGEYDEKRNILLDHLVPTPPPLPRDSLHRWMPYVAAGIGAFALLIALVLISSSPDSASDPLFGTTEGLSAAIQDATDDVDKILLGESWIGSGDYTILSAQKAYRSSEDYQVYSAKIGVPGAPALCLYWRADGPELQDGPVVGDSVTRGFSDWGSDVEFDSAADKSVDDSKNTPKGEAVIAATGCS